MRKIIKQNIFYIVLLMLSNGVVHASEAWDYVGEKKCEGRKFSTGQTHMRVEAKTEPTNKLLHHQEVIKKEDDTGWEFIHHSDQHIEWHLWANNGMFSAPEVILKIMYKSVPK